MEQNSNANQSTSGWLVAVLALCLIIGLVFFGMAASKLLDARDQLVAAQEKAAAPDYNPVGFDILVSENPEAYAWLEIPGTGISAPICQNAKDNGYYLTHDCLQQENPNGALYTEAVNGKSPANPITVIYGKNPADGSNFANLHNFADSQFFAENDTFYLYMPGHKFTYTVVSAFVSDDRHILNTYNYGKTVGFKAFLKDIQHPASMDANVRDGIKLTSKDKIVVLCTGNGGGAFANTRYLVCGVMASDTPTA